MFIKLRFFRKYLTFENHTNRLWNTHDNFVPPAVCARILKLVTSSYKVNSYIIFRKFLSYWFSCSLFGFDAIFLHEKLYSKYNIFFLLFQFPYIFGYVKFQESNIKTGHQECKYPLNIYDIQSRVSFMRIFRQLIDQVKLSIALNYLKSLNYLIGYLSK